MRFYNNVIPQDLQLSTSDDLALPGADGLGLVGRRLPEPAGQPALVSPLSNTGALIADEPLLKYPDGFAASPTVDWLAFTIHIQPEEKQKLDDDRIIRLNERFEVSPSDAILFLKSALVEHFGGGQPLPSGVNGYQAALSVLGTGRVCWHPDRSEMGVHVILPSTALSRYAQISKNTIYDLLHDMSTRGAKFTRIDLALDSDIVQMSTVIDAHDSGLSVTKAQKRQVIQDYIGNKPIGGVTLYIGSRNGRRMVRFYDKAAKENVSGVWTRCEVELKQEHAVTAVNHLLAGADARELILSSIDFRLDDNPEVNRRSRLDWWQDWVEVTTRVTFPITKAAATVADAMAWIVGQVTPTLSFLSMYMGNTYWLDSLIADAAKRVPGWKWDLLPDSDLGAVT